MVQTRPCHWQMSCKQHVMEGRLWLGNVLKIQEIFISNADIFQDHGLLLRALDGEMFHGHVRVKWLLRHRILGEGWCSQELLNVTLILLQVTIFLLCFFFNWQEPSPSELMFPSPWMFVMLLSTVQPPASLSAQVFCPCPGGAPGCLATITSLAAGFDPNLFLLLESLLVWFEVGSWKVSLAFPQQMRMNLLGPLLSLFSFSSHAMMMLWILALLEMVNTCVLGLVARLIMLIPVGNL